MFAAVYYFKTKAGKEDQFITAWEELTKLIYEFENSLGSRIHRKTENEFIAYAQWPDKETWSNSGANLPESANEFRILMKDACSEIRTEHELEMMSDFLKTNPSN